MEFHRKLTPHRCYAQPIKYGNIRPLRFCQNGNYCGLCWILASSRRGCGGHASDVHAIRLRIFSCHGRHQIGERKKGIRPRSYLFDGFANRVNRRNMALLCSDGKLALAGNTWEKVTGTLCYGPQRAAFDTQSRYWANPREVSLRYDGWRWLPLVRSHQTKTGIARLGSQVLSSAALTTTIYLNSRLAVRVQTSPLSRWLSRHSDIQGSCSTVNLPVGLRPYDSVGA
jgi:hypothetical protein